MTEDQRTPHYLYRTVFEQFKARIESGELAPNTPLPAERRLAAELGVALGTLRHATQLLRDEGLVVTVPSKGTFVCDKRSTRSLTSCGSAKGLGASADVY